MYNKSIKIIVIAMCSLFLTASAGLAQENTQLWLVDEHVVKPAHAVEYRELVEDFVEMCKENNDPFSFYAWSTTDYHYYYFYRVNDYEQYTDIQSVIQNERLPLFGEEKLNRFFDIVSSTNWYYYRTHLDNSYIPENPRMKNAEMNYVLWDISYVKAKNQAKIKEIASKFSALMKSKNYDDTMHILTGDIGVDSQVMIGSMGGKDRADFREQNSKMWELIGDEGTALYNEWIQYVEKRETKEFTRRPGMSYTAEPMAKNITFTDQNYRQKRSRLAWILDLNLAAALNFAKSEGKSAKDYGRHLGKLFAPDWERARENGPGQVASWHYINYNLWPGFEMEILEETDDKCTLRMNRPYARRFAEGKVYGITLEEYEDLWKYAYYEIMDYLDLKYEQKADGDHLLITISKK